MGAANRVTWRVEGMDCASCVAKVSRAVERLPGVSEVDVNLVAERLSASLAEGATPPEAVARQVDARLHRTSAGRLREGLRCLHPVGFRKYLLIFAGAGGRCPMVLFTPALYCWVITRPGPTPRRCGIPLPSRDGTPR